MADTTEIQDGTTSGGVATVTIGSAELPPPYSPPTAHAGIPMINCKVCQAPISLECKQHLLVVKCSVCGEATAGERKIFN
ncbi:hypothetical protein RRG08_026840 [Elysia crispata]|uniref:Phosphatidylinositol-4,5-bisphosphate 4-phosphatase n=1 Tax=Elysia crispata TaxID=231223 RepID=A0AAE0Y5W4_9GAST|nr:hypothetical protein RRG08_026840 [Elysia crispata]